MKRFLIFLIVILALPICAFAQDEASYEDALSGYDLSFFEDELSADTYDVLKELGISDFDYNSICDLSFESAFKVIKSIVQGKLETPIKGLISIIGFILISALFRAMKTDGTEDISQAYSVCTSLIISVVLIAQISPALTLAASSIELAGSFIYAFIPAFCIMIAACGGCATSFSTNTSLLLLSQGLNFISANVFMPLINCFLALGICSGLKSDLRLGNLINAMKKGITTVVSVISSLFISILSVKTSVSARADVLGIRSIRFVINSVVPVIGGSISEGLLSIQSYSSLIKSSVGIVGIIAITLVFLPSIIEITLWRAVLGIGAIVCELFGDDSVSLSLNAFRETALIVNIVLILSTVTTIISFGILIATRTA